MVKRHSIYQDFAELFNGVRETLAYIGEHAGIAFAEQVLAELGRQGMSRAELARRRGCTPPDVSKVLKGSPNLTIGTMARIAAGLGCAFHPTLCATKSIRKGENATRRSKEEDICR